MSEKEKKKEDVLVKETVVSIIFIIVLMIFGIAIITIPILDYVLIIISSLFICILLFRYVVIDYTNCHTDIKNTSLLYLKIVRDLEKEVFCYDGSQTERNLKKHLEKIRDNFYEIPKSIEEAYKFCPILNNICKESKEPIESCEGCDLVGNVVLKETFKNKLKNKKE